MLEGKKRTIKLSLVILAIICIVYNLCVLILGKVNNRTTTFILSWIFMNFSIVVVAIVLYFSKKQNSESLFFKYPTFKYSIIYLIVEFILSTIFLLIDKIIIWEIAFILQIILLAGYIIVALSCYAANDKISEIKTESLIATGFVQMLTVDSEMLVEKCADSNLKAQLKAFSDDVRHSDYFTHPDLTDIETDIKSLVRDCDVALLSGNNEYAEKTLKKAHLLLTERNKKCKVLRK